MFCIIVYMTLKKQSIHQAQRGSFPFQDESWLKKKIKKNFNIIHFNHSFFISSKVYEEHVKKQHFQTLEKKNLQYVHSLNYKQSRHDMKEYWVQEALKSW